MMTRRRKVLVGFIAALFVGLLGAACLPLWLPWVLPFIAKQSGASYTRYTRLGYHRFQLSGVIVTNSSGQFEAGRARAYIPTLWLWHVLAGSTARPFLEVDSWNWVSIPPVARDAAGPTNSAFEQYQSLESTAVSLSKWLPLASFTNGTIRAGTATVQVPAATWSGGRLTAALAVPQLASFNFQAAILGPNQSEIALRSRNGQLDARFHLARTNAQLRVGGDVLWLTNHIEVRAMFPRQGLVPTTAALRAPAFEIPARLLRMPGYGDLSGSLHAEWATNHYLVVLDGSAFPNPTVQLPPLQLAVRISGNLQSAQLEEARLSAPGLQAGLAEPTRILFHPPFLLQPAMLNLNGDLGQQPWLAARGLVSGQAIFRPSQSRFPYAEFAISGTNLAVLHPAVSNLAANTLQAQAHLRWPDVELSRFEIELTNGSSLLLTGICDLDAKTLRDGRLQFSGTIGPPLLPEGVSLQSAILDAQFAGPWRAITNVSRIDARGLKVPGLNPLRAQAQWTSRGLLFTRLDLSAAAGDSVLSAAGAAELGRGTNRIQLTALDLRRNQQPELQLQQPCEILLQLEPGAAPQPSGSRTNRHGNRERRAARWTLRAQPLLWAGSNATLQARANVNWPANGSFHLSAQGLDRRMVADFVEARMPQSRLDVLSCSGGWSNGPIDFQLFARAGLDMDRMPLLAEARVFSSTNGIVFEPIAISTPTQQVCSVQGLLPVRIEPGQTNGLIRILGEGRLALEAHTEPESVLWEKLSDAAGVVLRKPNLRVYLAGTWFSPLGRIDLGVERLQFAGTNRPLPAINDLQLTAEVNHNAARLSHLTASVEGQSFEATAEFPLGPDYWANLGRGSYLPALSNATARLRIPEADLGPFTLLLPKILAPQGTARANLALEPGFRVSGELSIEGVRTHPLPGIGSLRDIQARALFNGRSVVITNTSADIGGQAVAIKGSAQWDENLWLDKVWPRFEVTLTGTDVPLVREPNLLVRANLHLRATNLPPATPIVAGRIVLTNSLFLADLGSLVPGKTASPTQRPPYFSFHNQPWADWRLQVRIEGDEFMRVQTPLFQGRISAALTLGNTLETPIALGEVNINSGSITFPFGSLQVKQGIVTLSSANPYQPQLFITATAQRYGYDIRMEVTGSANEPRVQFTSTPPLGSEQIVVMLTTGQLPRGAGTAVSTRQQAQGFALFLGKNLLSDLGFGGGENRLTIRSGEQVTESGRTTYQVEYQLTPQFSVEGGYDRFDQFNLNLKWQVYSK